MANDGDYPTKSRIVPPADSTLNFYQEYVVGNKTDAAVTTPANTKSIVAMGKGTLNQLNTIIGMLNKNFTCDRNNVAVVDIDNTARFAVTIIDNDSGPIAQANITAGTITITRYRAGVATVIVNAVACSKTDGMVYYDYTFVTADWDTDDSYLVDMDGQEFTIGGTTYYPAISPWFGFIGDISTIEGKIDTIDTVVDAIQVDVGDPSTRTNFQNIEDMIGVPDAANSNVDDILRSGFNSSAITNNFDGSIIEIAKAGLEKDTLGAFDADTDSNEAISEAVANVDSDLATHDTDVKTLIGTPVTDLATDIADCDAQVVTSEGVVTGALATHDTDVKTLIGTPSTDLATDIDDVATLAIDIQTKVTVPIADSVANGGVGDVVGNKDDTVAGNSLVALAKTNAADVTAIKAVTDAIPDAGAMTSIAQESTLSTHDTDIKTLIGTPATDISADINEILSEIETTTQDIGDGTRDAFSRAGHLLRWLADAHPVPVEDAATDVSMRDVIGKKTDTVLGTSLVALVKSNALGISLVKAVTDVLPDAGAMTSIAQEATLGTPVSDIYTEMAKEGADSDTLKTLSDQLDIKESKAIFWSEVQPSVVIPAVAADLDFPNVVIPASAIPAGATTTFVNAILKWRKQVDSSGSTNAIKGASKTIRVKKSTGAWGTDDVIAIDVPDNTLSTDASSTEGGDMIVGDNNVSSVVDAVNATYNFRSEETNRSDAILVDGASLTLVDVQVGIQIRWV